jgi:hypothetical protein
VNSLIKNFRDWHLLESAAPGGSVFFVSSGTSSSNVQAKLAADLGCKPDILYTITFPGKDLLGALLSFYKRDGSKFGKSLKIDVGTQVNPGTDMLEIGTQRIAETGNVMITLSQATGITSMKASNNGLLAIQRLAEGIAAVKDLLNAQPSAAANWALSLTLGGNIEDNSSRGYSVWYAKLPNAQGDQSLTDLAKTIATVTATAILNGSKSKTGASAAAFLNLKDSQINADYTMYVKGKADPLAELMPTMVKVLRNRKILSNPTASSQAASGLLAKFIADQAVNLKFPTGSSQFITLTSAGVDAFAKICEAVINSVLPVTGPANFPNVPADLILSYSGLVKLMFGGRFKTAEYFDWVQQAHTYTNSTAKTGTTGAASSQKAEGEI